MHHVGHLPRKNHKLVNSKYCYKSTVGWIHTHTHTHKETKNVYIFFSWKPLGERSYEHVRWEGYERLL